LNKSVSATRLAAVNSKSESGDPTAPLLASSTTSLQAWDNPGKPATANSIGSRIFERFCHMDQGKVEGPRFRLWALWDSTARYSRTVHGEGAVSALAAAVLELQKDVTILVQQC
jgi:hypothetical protein